MAGSTARRFHERPTHDGRRVVHIDPATSVELDAVLLFMRTLWVTVHALQKASKRMNRTLRVTGPQRLVIRVVGLSPGISAGALAKVLHLHPSTLTGVLKRLEAQRLVSRARDTGDARRAVLRLTPGGQGLNVAMAGTVEAAVKSVLSRIPPRHQRAARSVLETLAEELDLSEAKPQLRPARRR